MLCSRLQYPPPLEVASTIVFPPQANTTVMPTVLRVSAPFGFTKRLPSVFLTASAHTLLNTAGS